MRPLQRASLRAVFVTCAVVGMLLIASTSVFADGNGATSFTQTFHNATQTFSPPDPSASNPCTGAAATIQLTYNGVFHITVNGAGDGWVTGTQTGAIVLTPVDPTQPSYTGHFATWFGGAENNRNFLDHFTFSVNAVGSDGSTLTFHETGHFSVSASGMTETFDKTSCG